MECNNSIFFFVSDDQFTVPSSYSDSEGPRSTSSSTDLSSISSSSHDLSSSLSTSEINEEDEEPNAETESTTSDDLAELSTVEDETEVIYSDPLDALEKATDTRIYNCPEFDETEEAIYEEAGGGVAPKIEVIKPSPKQSPKRRKRASISTATAMPPSFKSEDKHLQRRSHSYIQQSVTSKFSSIKSSSSDNKRLSAVLSKYIKPNIAKQTWQIDSSSWEFLHQSGTNEDIPETLAENEDSVAETTTTKCKQDSTTSSSDKSKQTDSGLDSTLSFTNKSDDKDSVYESEMGTLNTEPNKSQLSKSQDKIKDYVTQQLATEQWMFGRMVSQFNDCTQTVSSSQILSTLSNIRQFINGMKNYLVRHGEGDLHQIIKEERTKVF